MNQRAVTTLWGDPVPSTDTWNQRMARSYVDVQSRATVTQWLVFCELVAGGFSSPLLRAGRQEGGLFRTHLNLVPVSAAKSALVLHFVGAHQTVEVAVEAISGALRRVAEGDLITPSAWSSASIRLATRLVLSGSPRRSSMWLRSPYDAWRTAGNYVTPLLPIEVYAGPLSALLAALRDATAEAADTAVGS